MAKNSNLLMNPLTQADLSGVRLVATDMDGTLTRHGKFTVELLSALESLQKAQIPVLIVTGRSAGWVSAVANYLPIFGAIAENGGLFFHNQQQTREFIGNFANLSDHRQQLKQVWQRLQTQFPQIQESADNTFRLTDWTFDIGDLTIAELEQMATICHQENMGFTYSTVQCHIKPAKQEKAIALQQVIASYFPELSPKQVVTVGDSPNDESLFNSAYFPLSVGVANITDYSDRLHHTPAYIATMPEVGGFGELSDQLTICAREL